MRRLALALPIVALLAGSATAAPKDVAEKVKSTVWKSTLLFSNVDLHGGMVEGPSLISTRVEIASRIDEMAPFLDRSLKWLNNSGLLLRVSIARRDGPGPQVDRRLQWIWVEGSGSTPLDALTVPSLGRSGPTMEPSRPGSVPLATDPTQPPEGFQISAEDSFYVWVADKNGEPHVEVIVYPFNQGLLQQALNIRSKAELLADREQRENLRRLRSLDEFVKKQIAERETREQVTKLITQAREAREALSKINAELERELEHQKALADVNRVLDFVEGAVTVAQKWKSINEKLPKDRQLPPLKSDATNADLRKMIDDRMKQIVQTIQTSQAQRTRITINIQLYEMQLRQKTDSFPLGPMP